MGFISDAASSVGSGLKSIGNKILGNGGQTAVQADDSASQAAMQALNGYNQGQNSPAVQDIISKYSSGQMSLQDAMGQLGSTPGGQNALLGNGLAGSQAASNFVQNDSLSKGLFGQGGIQDQAQGQFGQLNQNVQDDRSKYLGMQGNLADDRNALMGRDQSYGLTDQDLAAYGQASGNISRMFANQGQSLAQSLADRGLASGSNGATAAGYAGLMGNQNEQLAGLQQQIAQNRIQTAQGLAQARTQADLSNSGQMQNQQGLDTNAVGQNNQLMTNLGSLGQSAMNNQYNRQLSGAQNQYNQLAGAASTNLQNTAQQQNINNENFAQQQATKQPGLLDQLGNSVSSTPASYVNGINGALTTGPSSALGAGAGAAAQKAPLAAAL